MAKIGRTAGESAKGGGVSRKKKEEEGGLSRSITANRTETTVRVKRREENKNRVHRGKTFYKIEK